MENILNSLDSLSDFQKFEAVNTKTGEKVRCMKEPKSGETSENAYFVFAKGKKRYGFRYDKETFAKIYTPVIKTDEEKTKKWHRDIRRALSEIERTGFWKGSSMERILKNLLTITLKEKKDIFNLYNECGDNFALRTEKMLPYMEKYPFLFNTGQEDEIVPIPDFNYYSELADCKLKSMYFGRGSYVKEQIKEAMAQKRDTLQVARTSYDVSFELRQPTKDVPYIRAWYSEEYKGCGNGHYYLALSENCAIFCEND